MSSMSVANCGWHAASDLLMHFNWTTTQLLECLQQTDCEWHFMLLTNILHTYFFKSLQPLAHVG